MQPLAVIVLALAGLTGFVSRVFSVIRYESIIHEFDPWFNYRSTAYLIQNGFYNFLNWFDERSWYPLGRIVGGTVYPGLMITSSSIYWVLHAFNINLDIRDICVFIAPIFSGLTSVATYLLTSEVWSEGAGLFAACFIAVTPGYTNRSVAGSYDNESIALFALQLTYYLWLKSLKTGSIFWSICTSLSYFYMVSAWGGYVFIINLIPLHVFVLLIMGRYSKRLFTSYTIFYIVGLLYSMQIPFVGFLPVRTSEHMAAAGIFVLLMTISINKYLHNLNPNDSKWKQLLILISSFFVCLSLFVGILLVYFRKIAPWNGRFYALWDSHFAAVHTPIITSVAEHRPTTWYNFFMDLHLLMCTFPVGLWYCIRHISDVTVFVALYGISAVYFAARMVRLMSTFASVACVLSGIAFSILQDYILHQNPLKSVAEANIESESTVDETKDSKETNLPRKGSSPAKFSFVIIITFGVLLVYFCLHCTWVTSTYYSSPNIMFFASARYSNDRTERKIIDDYREAYSWLSQNTAEQAKVISWWDYGYQISGLGNRTTIVDNNTWNYSHIALVGKAMASNETAAYNIMTQLDVDYVLIIFGGAVGYPSDDLNKFTWMVKIAEGEHPNEIRFRNYFPRNNRITVDSEATNIMLNCLLYKLSYYKFKKPMERDKVRDAVPAYSGFRLNYLEEAFTSAHWIVRIYRVKKPHEFNRPRIPRRERIIKTTMKLSKKTKNERKGQIKSKAVITKGKIMKYMKISVQREHSRDQNKIITV